jgi:hypothetical protein
MKIVITKQFGQLYVGQRFEVIDVVPHGGNYDCEKQYSVNAPNYSGWIPSDHAKEVDEVAELMMFHVHQIKDIEEFISKQTNSKYIENYMKQKTFHEEKLQELKKKEEDSKLLRFFKKHIDLIELQIRECGDPIFREELVNSKEYYEVKIKEITEPRKEPMPEEKKSEFFNDSDYEFVDISSEEFRQYAFENSTIEIVEPVLLSVSESGAHRIFDAEGVSHYISPGWLAISWKAKPGRPHFEF